MKLLFCARDKYGCGWYRVRQNMKWLKARGHTCDETLNEPPNILSDEELRQYDLIVMQDHGSIHGNNLVFRAKKLKIPVVCDADDFYQHLQPANPGFASWNPGTLYQFRTLQAFENCDALTVSTEALAKEYFLYNKHIYIVPNYLDNDLWDVPLKRHEDGIVRIGWAGGQAHILDLRMIKYVIEAILEKYKGRVKFHTMGIGDKDLKGIFKGDLRKDKCERCGNEGDLQYDLGQEMQDYPLVLASYRWDIALAPIVDNSFNKMKSDLKFKEYGCLNMAGVYSKCEPYVRSVKHGETGLIAETYEEWVDAISQLIDNEELRTKIGNAAKQESKKWMIEDNIYKLEDIYLDIINNYKKDGSK